MARRLQLISLLLGVLANHSLCAQPPPVPPIDLPHPYYYREMYLPQLTSGPSSVAWAPDSREVVFSMGGSLWRQKIDSTSAEQLTDGPGYDYQPDWSPDGRFIRSEEHTSELQSRRDLVCRLLLEKKKYTKD